MHYDQLEQERATSIAAASSLVHTHAEILGEFGETTRHEDGVSTVNIVAAPDTLAYLVFDSLKLLSLQVTLDTSGTVLGATAQESEQSELLNCSADLTHLIIGALLRAKNFAARGEVYSLEKDVLYEQVVQKQRQNEAAQQYKARKLGRILADIQMYCPEVLTREDVLEELKVRQTTHDELSDQLKDVLRDHSRSKVDKVEVPQSNRSWRDRLFGRNKSVTLYVTDAQPSYLVQALQREKNALLKIKRDYKALSVALDDV